MIVEVPFSAHSMQPSSDERTAAVPASNVELLPTSKSSRSMRNRTIIKNDVNGALPLRVVVTLVLSVRKREAEIVEERVCGDVKDFERVPVLVADGSSSDGLVVRVDERLSVPEIVSDSEWSSVNDPDGEPVLIEDSE